MRNKYWAKEEYGQIDPVDYASRRFTTSAGELIDEAEKKSVLNLLLNSEIVRRKELKILDVATGPGRLAFYLENHLQEADITGVDINENMLKRAGKIAENNQSKVRFMEGDLYNLPFEDGQFDVIVGLRFSMHIPQIDKVIKEFSRILKNDGVLIFDIFNYNSILRLKSMDSHSKKEDYGFHTIQEINGITKDYGFEFRGYKGILFFGETLLRKFPSRLLFLFYPTITPSKLIERFSSKLVLCFRKHE